MLEDEFAVGGGPGDGCFGVAPAWESVRSVAEGLLGERVSDESGDGQGSRGCHAKTIDRTALAAKDRYSAWNVREVW